MAKQNVVQKSKMINAEERYLAVIGVFLVLRKASSDIAETVNTTNAHMLRTTLTCVLYSPGTLAAYILLLLTIWNTCTLVFDIVADPRKYT